MRNCILIVSALYLQWSCQTLPVRDTRPLIPKSDTSSIEKNNRLIAFVGEKIAVQPLPRKQGSMDAAFLATYKVLQNVYGNYPNNTIEFTAYDHYGQPAFSKFKNVLLFVYEYQGKYYHEKYQYADLYKTKSGRWASPYKTEDYNHIYNKNTTIKPVIVEFAEQVAYPVKVKWYSGDEVTVDYPTPFFKLSGDSAIAVYGNFLEDIFALKRSGILAARELFDVTPEREEAEVQSTANLESDNKPLPDDSKFMAFWKLFAASLKEPCLKEFKRVALDSLLVCDQLLATDTFLNKCFKQVFDDEAMKRLGTNTGKQYTWSEADFAYLNSSAKKAIVKVGRQYRFRQVLVARSSRHNSAPVIEFKFIETRNGYRLYGIDHHWFKACCL